ncbi:MAG: hypothetical protein KGI49_02430 [Patescibacteria group bacterium]|nr:hypothetical protein [Patescibacteria group bacterium]
MYLIILIVFASAGLAFWYFFLGGTGGSGAQTSNTNSNQPGFQPFSRTSPGNGGQAGNNASGTASSTGQAGGANSIPTLRLLSSTPVGGYGASTTASTTIVRWVDRGRGNIYQADYISSNITTLSNTIVPRIYESGWNSDISSFIGMLLQDGDPSPQAIYAQLIPVSAATGTPQGANYTPYALRGKNLPSNVASYAVSPDGKQIFLFSIQGGQGIGYISQFSGGTATRIFSTPITQVNVDWPAPDIIAITTKGSAYQNGYLYFVNPKTGIWKEVAGPLPGLSAKVSHDGKYAVLSATGNNNNVLTSIYSIASSTGTDAVIRTMADKCAWGNFYRDVVYCAAPSQPVSGIYPDDWYQGRLSTVDKIWQVDAISGQVHLISSIIDQSDRVIDAFNLGLDQKDDYLFFMNKNDLSLWSLDLVRSQ